MLFLKLQLGFDEDLITKIIMKVFFNWLLFLFYFGFFFNVIKIYCCPKIEDMHVWF